MKAIVFLALLTIVFTGNQLTSAKYKNDDGQLHWWDTDDNDEYNQGSSKPIPFPQCLLSKSGSRLFDSPSFQKLFDRKLAEEEYNLKQEGYENYKHHQDDTMDYETTDLRRGNSESRTTARAALKLTRDIMTVLMCDLNRTDTTGVNTILSKFSLPKEFCSYLDKPSCGDRQLYRTITGVCNNLHRPYEGSSQTAFGRMISAAYDDHLSEPRRKSSRGGYLPSCRHLSLSLGSRPIFNRNYNNLFVTFGQVIAHDVALSTPVSDTYSRPISSCRCSDKYDWDKCNVIDIAPDDPHLRGQKCMAFPATAQAFRNQVCSLGVKEQINGNTHLPDLSILYGSTVRTAEALRGENGLLKSSRFQWSKHELPPGQREGKSCIDATSKRKCFAGGDSRLMIHLLFTGVHSIFLRLHNQLAQHFAKTHPTWESNQIYEEARAINIAFFQRLIYEFWLPILLGKDKLEEVFGTDPVTTYDPEASSVVNNEFSTAGFRLHSLVRDLFSRCTYDGTRIDERWLHDILHKAKYAYDTEHNGLDSILCGAFYDYGFAYDGNFAHQIHNRLFESNNQYGQLWRNDLVAINICRGREHGIPSYNELLEKCGFVKAESFEELSDTMNYDSIKKLKYLYKDVDDIDLFVGLNLEDPIAGGLVGPVSACIISQQFKAFRDADRFFYTHPDALTPEQLTFVKTYPVHCLFCKTIDIEKIPSNPFKSPFTNNPLQDCSECDASPLNPPASGKVEATTGEAADTD